MAQVICQKCGKLCKSLQGWKGHMSGQHGGYDEEDLAAVTGVGGGEGDVRQRMENFASTMPGDAQDADAGASTHQPPLETAGRPGPAPAPTERRVKATPRKLKKILGGIPAKILEQSGIKLDSE